MSARLLSKEKFPIWGLQHLVHKGYVHKGKLASVDNKTACLLKEEKYSEELRIRIELHRINSVPVCAQKVFNLLWVATSMWADPQKAELVCLFRSACQVFLNSMVFQFQEALLKHVPFLNISHHYLNTLKSKTVSGRKWFIKGSQGTWLLCFHFHLSLNDKQREVFMCQEGGGRGMYFKRSYQKNKRWKAFLLTDS